MAKLSDVKQRGRSWLVAAVFIVIGVVVGQLIPRSTVTPASETGTVTAVKPGAGGSGADFVFKPQSGSPQSYAFSDRTPWQDKPGTWHRSGMPSCMVPQSGKPRRVTIGVVNVKASGTQPGGPLVVWVQCQG